MNLNEKCLLDYLQNPDELEGLTAILEENIQLLKDRSNILVATPLVS